MVDNSKGTRPGDGLVVSRRALLRGMAAFGALAPLGAVAQPRALPQAEWGERFDPGTRAVQVPRSIYPTLSPTTLTATEQAIYQYSDIVQNGGWPTVSSEVRLKLGVKHASVTALRRRLEITGDLPPNRSISDVFDSYVEAAVRRFQTRHGLVLEGQGQITKPTLEALNVPAQVRLRQLETNMVRLRSQSGDLGERFVMVNIPAADIEVVDAGQVVSRHTAVVGKIDRQSPLITAKIHEVKFNPHWTVPASIIRKDLIPKMQTDPQYLAKNNIRMFDHKGNEFDPLSINWQTNEATQYLFRQDPGDINSLGSVKINFHNTHQVYMHDTPSKNLFGGSDRFHSSGCVRVQNIRELIVWLLRDTGAWTSAQYDAVVRSGEQTDVKLPKPVNLYWVYVTAWALPDGTVQFRNDIYDRDGLGQFAMTAQ